MEMEMMVKLISSLGFPIFTAVYLMTRMELQLKRNNELLAKLSILIDRESRNNG